MERPDHQGPSEPPAPGLLILTGASHTGKTTVADAILQASDPPAAFLSVDQVLEHTISRPPGDRWAQIPLAYELLEPQVETLLERHWLVVFESTFTYVPENDTGEFHREQLMRLVHLAERSGMPSLVAQIVTRSATAQDRADHTGRLPREIVKATVQLHRSAPLPAGSLRIDADKWTSSEIAERVLRAFANLRSE